MDIVNEVILSLDPSSKAIGWAIMLPPVELVGGGVITPDDKTARSFDRIVNMCESLAELLKEIEPGSILIEWTLGKVGQRRHKGGGAGLSVYGAGVGYAAAICRSYTKAVEGCELIPILENDWTRGVKKRERQLAVIQEYPHYLPDLDPGGDLSDAIGMAVWWLREQRIRSWDFWTG